MRSFLKSLAVRNLVKRPGRSAALIILTAFLSLSVFGGTLIISSLRTGLSSLQARLGADIMVVPYQAVTKANLSNIVLQGNTGYFYMDKGIYEKIAAMEGIEKVSPQFFLSSTSSGCCSIPVQIIGIDPETDFTIQPWIKKIYPSDLRDMEIVVGNDLNAFVGDDLSFYGTDVHVAGKLDKTGTYLDQAVCCSENTIKALIQSSLERKMNDFTDIDPDNVVSCVLIKVAEDYPIEEVLNDINIHVRKVEAIQTKNMISGISGSLSGVSDIIGFLAAAVWVLALVILVVAFIMSTAERKKEFAVLRAMGASRKKLSGIVMTEGILVSALGSLAGAALGALLILPFCNFIQEQLGLPFLLPGPGRVILAAVLSIVLSAAAGSLASAFASLRISRIDTGFILREGN